MTLNDLAAISWFVGGVAVLITPVYLAMRVRNKTSEVRSDRLRSEVDAYVRQQTGYLSGHDSIAAFRRGLYDYPSLPPKEKMLFHFFMVNQILAVQNFIQQYHEGLIPKVVLIASLDFLAQLLSIRGGAKYWAETSGIFASIVAEAINAHLGNFTKPPYVYQPPRFDDLGTVAGRSA